MTVESFAALIPSYSAINLFVSGTLGISDFRDREEDRNPEDLQVIGITINNLYQSGNVTRNQSSTLRQCREILVKLKDNALRLVVDDRKVYPQYTYFRVHSEDQLAVRPAIRFVTGSLNEQDILYYYTSTGSSTDIDFTPYYGVEYNLEEYNPLLNNATGSVKSTFVRKVDFLKGDQIPTNLEALSNGSAEFVEVPDSYYTSVGNMTGRFLGTKTVVGDEKRYIFNKSQKTKKVLESQHKDGNYRGEDQPVLGLQQCTGSVYSIGSKDDTIFSIDLSNMTLEEVLYTAYAYTVTKDEKVKGSEKTDYMVYQPKNLSLPREGDILYKRSGGKIVRLPEKKVYVPDEGALHYTDEYGIIIKSIKTPENISSYYLRTLLTEYPEEPYYGCYHKVLRVLSDQVIPQMFFIKFRIQFKPKPGESQDNLILNIPLPGQESKFGYDCGPSPIIMVGDEAKEVWTGFNTFDGCIGNDTIIEKWGITSITVRGQEYRGAFSVDGHTWNADWFDTFDVWYSEETRKGPYLR